VHSASIGKKPIVAPYSGAMLAIVARSTTGSAAGAGAVELDELADDLGLPEELGDREREVGRGHALAQRAGQVDADDVGRQEIDRLAEHARLGLDAADAPADDPEAVDHRRVGVGADERVGIETPSASLRTPLARNSRFTWWTMPIPGARP
jgi:hypothetical protein